MTKIVNLSQKGKVSRAVISKFGEHLYHNPEVKRIMIKVKFKDGSTIGFSRDEEEDDFKGFFMDDEE